VVLVSASGRGLSTAVPVDSAAPPPATATQSEPCVSPDGTPLTPPPLSPGRDGVTILCTFGAAPGSSRFASSGHATVNTDPYAMVVTSDTSAGNGITLYVNTTTVWEGSVVTAGGGPASGIPLSAFAATVEGALGRGQGALAMLGLASKGGYLNLEQEAVARATPAGTGSVDGTSVTYYDATLDLTKLADDPTLTAEEHTTMQAALVVLRDGGYTGTTETIGVDADGFIREITATTRYSDGSSSTRHSILSNFGCAAKVYTPDQVAPTVTTTVPCAPPATTAPAATTPPLTGVPTTAPPTTVSSTTTSVPPTTATTEPPTSTEPSTTPTGSP